jgi:glycosyltransferase involved in cell wall biosynthesis
LHGSVLGFFAYGALQTREVANRDVLEVGSLDVNGSVRPMVESRGPRSYLGVDVVDGPGVDRICDAKELLAAFGPDAFDVVISTEMLEHVDDWQRAVAAMVGVLRPGGILVVTTRSPGFAYHHPPDRWRYTQPAMAEITERVGLELLVLMDDPEFPGVFWKARKPEGWRAPAILDPLAGVPGITPMPDPLRVLGLPGQADGTSYYRFTLPFNHLLRAGHTVHIPGPVDAYVDSPLAADSEVLVQQRPHTPQAWDRLKRLAGGPALVYETDDHILAPDPSGLAGWLDPQAREATLACLRLADLVTVSTEPLAAALRAQVDVPVVVLPDCIDPALLSLDAADHHDPDDRRREPVVFWAGGSNHLQDLQLLADPIRELGGDRFDLHLAGVDYRPILGGRGRFSPWQPDIWDYYRTVDADIGLAPLADTAFNRARAPIRAIEWGALGVPVIASAIPPYADYIRHGETGLLADSPTAWVEAVRWLVNDPDARRELGAKARQQASEQTIREHGPRWAATYQQAATRRRQA